MLQNNDWSERVKNEQSGSADKGKSIWSRMISNVIRDGMYFEANENDCRGLRMLNKSEIVFWNYCKTPMMQNMLGYHDEPKQKLTMYRCVSNVDDFTTFSTVSAFLSIDSEIFVLI